MSRHRQSSALRPALRPALRGPCSPAADPGRRLAERAVAQWRARDPEAALSLDSAARACLPAGSRLSAEAAARIAEVSLRRAAPPRDLGAERHPCTGARLRAPGPPPAAEAEAEAAARLASDWRQAAADVGRVEARCWLGLRRSVTPGERERLRAFALLREP